MDYVETIKNNPKTQKDLEQIVNKFSNDSYRTQSQKKHDAIIHRRNFEETIGTIGETFADMD